MGESGNTIKVMGLRDPGDPPTDPNRDRPRHPGWAVLVGLLGIVLVFIGAMLIAMLDAPVVRPRVIFTGFVLIVAGLLLLPVAWLGRHRNGQ